MKKSLILETVLKSCLQLLFWFKVFLATGRFKKKGAGWGGVPIMPCNDTMEV